MIGVNKKYRNIYILESRAYWPEFSKDFDSKDDVVLTYDFGLKNLVESLGGRAFYVDSLCSTDEMEKNNFLAAEFLKKWHYDKFGNDIFLDHGVSFGFVFRIEIWSEYLSYVRLFANLNKLNKLKFKKLFIHNNNQTLLSILDSINLPYELHNKKNSSREPSYFFDIDKYMLNALHGKSLKDFIRKAAIFFLSHLRFALDRFLYKKDKKTIYVQIYHPTKPILSQLLKNEGLRVVTCSLISSVLRNFFYQRLIPTRLFYVRFNKRAIILFRNFIKNRNARLILYDGSNVTNGVFSVIEKQIEPKISEVLSILDSTINYIQKYPINLEVMMANLGLSQTIMNCILKSKQVPSYLIINGLLCHDYLDEGKYATYINSYSKSIKKHYYNNARNIFCLGDPRMDFYVGLTKKLINKNNPTVTIGASGFNNIDLNSYVAVEFDFMFDILTAFRSLKSNGHLFSIVIKVRPNGVLEQYRSFVNEYFSDLPIDLLRVIPMIDVLKKTDLYISIYSQTLFEASCLGIPVIYYKKDKEVIHAPFDCKSELVTVNSVDDLKKAFLDFKNSHSRFNKFLDKSVMEKYIGPLDGKNLKRNLDFIYGLLGKHDIGALH